MSNDDRVMLTLIADTCGRHDTCAGCCPSESNAFRFGAETKYQHACRENFLLEGAKHGLCKRDVVPNVNFFMNVPIDANGDFTVADGIGPAGAYVDLIAEEMDVLCLISNCPQVNNPCNGFNPTAIRVLILDA